MTREEALEIFEHNWTCLKNHAYTDNELDEALKFAIKALEREPCEDFISRKAIDEVKELMTDINGHTVYAVKMSDIRQLFSVTPQEPKTDMWSIKEVADALEKHGLLEQEPCSDAISRHAMHIELEKWITYGEYKYSNATKYLYDRIDRLPPVNPQESNTEPNTDILDKIRAEIKTKYDSIPWRNNDYDDGWVEALEWVLFDVIDKYKAESEDKECVKNG